MVKFRQDSKGSVKGGKWRIKKTATCSLKLDGGLNKIRPRPTLPHSCPCSTIGAERLNFRVRNGNGCGPFANKTGKLIRY